MNLHVRMPVFSIDIEECHEPAATHHDTDRRRDRAGRFPLAPSAARADGVAEPAGAARGGHGCGRDGGPGLVIINAATSVRCRYYSRFAEYLHGHGFDVLTYDYRGIGESRPASMRGFQASWMDWGQKDFEAVLTYARREFPGQPVDVAAHSIGGFVTGLAPSSHRLRRIFTMGRSTPTGATTRRNAGCACWPNGTWPCRS